MIERVIKGLGGEDVVELIPETDKDVAVLRDLALKAALDDRDSFADDEGAAETVEP
jgi:hypothetical protein